MNTIHPNLNGSTPEVRARQAIELRIVRRVVRDLIKAGYSISVDNGGDTYEIKRSTDAEAVLAVMFATDDETLHVRKPNTPYGAWVKLIYGNDGYDVVSDYTTDLEVVMEHINNWVDNDVEGEILRQIAGK